MCITIGFWWLTDFLCQPVRTFLLPWTSYLSVFGKTKLLLHVGTVPSLNVEMDILGLWALLANTRLLVLTGFSCDGDLSKLLLEDWELCLVNLLGDLDLLFVVPLSRATWILSFSNSSSVADLFYHNCNIFLSELYK